MSKKITLNLGDDLISLVLKNGEKVTLTIVSENDEPSIHSLYKSNVSVDNSTNNNIEDAIGYDSTFDDLIEINETNEINDDYHQLINNDDEVFNRLMVKKSSPELNHENVPAYSPLQLSELDDNDSYDVTEDMQSDVSQKTAVNPSFYDDVSRLSSPSQFELDDEEYVSPIIPNDESEDIEDVFEEKPSSIKEILKRESELSESESNEDENNTSVETNESETDTDVNTEESSDQNDDVLLNEDNDVNVNESDESENDSDDSVANRDELALFGSSNDDENIDEIVSDDDSEDDDESNDNYSNGFFFEPVDDDDESDEREF